MSLSLSKTVRGVCARVKANASSVLSRPSSSQINFLGKFLWQFLFSVERRKVLVIFGGLVNRKRAGSLSLVCVMVRRVLHSSTTRSLAERERETR